MAKQPLLCPAQGSQPLPPQAHLLTLKQLPDGKVLLRLAHLYQQGEQGSASHGMICFTRSRVADCLSYGYVLWSNVQEFPPLTTACTCGPVRTPRPP